MSNEVIINEIHERDLKELLESRGLKNQIKKNKFVCAGCGRTITMDEIVYIKSVKPWPTVELSGNECWMKARRRPLDTAWEILRHLWTGVRQ